MLPLAEIAALSFHLKFRAVTESRPSQEANIRSKNSELIRKHPGAPEFLLLTIGFAHTHLIHPIGVDHEAAYSSDGRNSTYRDGG